MKESRKILYMDIAERFARESHCVRKRVGAVIIKDDFIIAHGWNGTVSGEDNCCETKEYMKSDAPCWLDWSDVEEQWPYEDTNGRYRLVTKPDVVHAERNALMRLARSTETSVGASLFVTLEPCAVCASLIAQAGIYAVYYKEPYPTNSGIELLKRRGIIVEKV